MLEFKIILFLSEEMNFNDFSIFIFDFKLVILFFNLKLRNLIL